MKSLIFVLGLLISMNSFASDKEELVIDMAEKCLAKSSEIALKFASSNQSEREFRILDARNFDHKIESAISGLASLSLIKMNSKNYNSILILDQTYFQNTRIWRVQEFKVETSSLYAKGQKLTDQCIIKGIKKI